jgi:alpha-amylase
MPSVCFYFEVHQPYRLKPYGALQVGRDHVYFDDTLNAEVLRKVASKCYLPANESMLRLIEKTDGRFRHLLRDNGGGDRADEAPRAGGSRQLSSGSSRRVPSRSWRKPTITASPPCTTRTNIREQIELELGVVKKEFGQTPRVFRNTELIYNDEIGRHISDLGFDAILVEGADDILAWRSPNFVYRVPGRETRLLAKNYKLSDDIAFRFSNRAWAEWPLTAEKFARGCTRQRRRRPDQPVHGLRDLRRAPVGRHGHLRVPRAPSGPPVHASALGHLDPEPGDRPLPCTG